jgi:hypothetical protein
VLVWLLTRPNVTVTMFGKRCRKNLKDAKQNRENERMKNRGS